MWPGSVIPINSCFQESFCVARLSYPSKFLLPRVVLCGQAQLSQSIPASKGSFVWPGSVMPANSCFQDSFCVARLSYPNKFLLPRFVLCGQAQLSQQTLALKFRFVWPGSAFPVNSRFRMSFCVARLSYPSKFLLARFVLCGQAQLSQ